MRNFIFSNKFLWRFSRHSAFWIARIISLIISHCIGNYNQQTNLFNALKDSIIYIPLLVLISDIPFCYTVIYFLIPTFFLKRKYVLFTAGLLFISTLTFIASCLYRYKYHHLTPNLWFEVVWNNAIGFIFVGAVTICGVFLSIKMLKTWYMKEEEKQMLLKANAKAEMQLLKAQIHPHFLFNTLNNIYSFTLNKSLEAAGLVSKLSDTMSYMITDCSAEFISLEEELKMIQNYIGLEKVRYGKRLDISINIEGEYLNKIIAPLLMIPFIENSFKHGASKMLTNPWIKLTIEIKESVLYFTLLNGKPDLEINTNTKSGIGLTNVKKRLGILYPGKHYLKTESTRDTFIVEMQIPLQENGLMEEDISFNEMVPVQA